MKRTATTSRWFWARAQRLVAVAGVAVALLAVHLLIGFTRGEITRTVVVGILVVAAVIIGLRIRHRPLAGILDPRHGISGVLAGMWVAVTVGPLHTIAKRSIHDAVSSPGSDALVEIVGYGAIGAACVLVLRELVPHMMELRFPLALLIFPLLATVSATWSSIASYSFGKGLQLLVLALLAITTLAFARSGGDVERLLGTFLRALAVVAFVLVIARTVFGPIYITGTGDNLERFALIGMNANLGAFLVGLSLVIVVATPDRLLQMSPGVRVVAVAVFVAALLPMQSRTSIVTLALGLGTVLLLAARRNDHLRIRVVPTAVTLVLAGALVFREELGSYLLRGGSSETLTGGNGRIGLWGQFLEELRTPFDAVFGLGYGQAKVVLIDEVSWATNAHNSILSVVVGLGLVGLGSYLWLLLYGATAIVRSRLVTTDVGAVVLGLTGMLVGQMAASDAIAEPAGGLSLLYLLTVVAVSVAEERTVEEAARTQVRRPISSAAITRSSGSSISTQAGEATGAAP